jgi:hypothetical protein
VALSTTSCSVTIGTHQASSEPEETYEISRDFSDEQVVDSFERGDCHRCHEVPGRAPVARIDSCTDCHLWIRSVSSDPVKRSKAKEIFPLWERYEQNVSTYFNVPSLEAGMARLKPEWVMKYLADPYDTRPGMAETMPRFNLTKEEIESIGFAFRRANKDVPKTPAPQTSRVPQGAGLFVEKGCMSCHSFGALHHGLLGHAPDLMHARSRMTPDMIAAWILDPQAVSTAATMTSLGLTREESLAIRDYLVLADPKAKPAPKLGPVPKATKNPVRYEEVRDKVFGKICVHCHMDPEANEGRAGPGNGGGFGWVATGIELETYEGVVAAAKLIPDALLRRRLESGRDDVKPGFFPVDLTRPEKSGMPLGLPPLPDEDISLVLGWIEQGMPR